MARPLDQPDGYAMSIRSAAHLPHGTPIRQCLDATAPEIRLVIGHHDDLELNMDLAVAGQMITTLRTAVRELRAAHSSPPTNPDAA